MKKLITSALMVVSASFSLSAQAQDAKAFSLAILNKIPAAEKELKKAIEYGDESGYMTLQAAPMAAALRNWRDARDKEKGAFEKYDTCLYAGVDYQRFALASFKRSLQSDREADTYSKSYKEYSGKCKKALNAKN